MAEGKIIRKGGGGGAEITGLGPGPQELVAGTYIAGFFGQVSQADFGITMTQVMSDLNITEGTAQNTSEPLLKFIHRGKIKFINKKSIRHSIPWEDIASEINVYGGTTMTFGGNSYKVRLMRGWGQVSGSPTNVTTPDYENGPIYTVDWFSFIGVNWPENDSDWSANNPNEWNTLMFPISSESQSQTGGVPDWASYSNADLNIAAGAGNGYATWTQETVNEFTNYRVNRGLNTLEEVNFAATYNSFFGFGLRLVFELI